MAVLVTRPDERGKALVDQLNQAGMVALYLPLLSIEAGAELAQLPTKLNQLKSGDYVFLVSKSAVDFADKMAPATDALVKRCSAGSWGAAVACIAA